MALEDRIHDERAPIAVVERGEGRGPARAAAAVDDVAVDLLHHVTEGVAPCFLMTAGKAGIRLGGGREQRRILEQQAVRAVTVPKPELVLAFLIPAHRFALSVDLEPQVVLVT